MYFYCAFKFNMTLSSADYHFKQFRPRSGLTFCPDLIGVQTVKHFRGYEKFKLNLSYPLKCLTVWTPIKSGKNVRPDLGLNCLKWLSVDDNDMLKFKSKIKHIGSIST